MIKNTNNSVEILNTRLMYSESVTEGNFLSDRIMLIVKQYGKENKQHLNLSGVYIFNSDASGVYFSGIDIYAVTFSNVDLTNAKLTPTRFEKFDPTYSNWWDAAEIDQDLLEILVSSNYPGYVEREPIYTNTAITKDYYENRIDLLCRPAKSTCQKANLRFEDRFVIIKTK